MKRRMFLEAAFAAVVSGPALWLARHVGPRRFVEAVRARFYPGRVRAFDASRLEGPGKWGG